MSGPRVAVVGGGLAGLAASLRLASRGASVVTFERSTTVGGKAGELRIDGFRFDTGPTVVTLPDVLRATFEDAGVGSAPAMEALDPMCRYRLPSGRWWDVSRDPGRTAAQLGPGQARAYTELLDEARSLFEGAAPTFVYGRKPGPVELLRYALVHGAAAHPFATMAELVRRRGADRDLEAFFLRFATYAGADPYRTPAVLLNIAWAELGLGAVWLRGGVHALVAALRSAAEEADATVMTGAGVRAVEVATGRVRAVWAGGSRWPVDAVVSAVDREATRSLVGRPPARNRSGASLSGFVLLIGVEGSDPGGVHHNVVFSDDYPREFDALRRGRLPDDPTLYLSVSSRSQLDDAPIGHENWFVMANAPALPAHPGPDPVAGARPPADAPAFDGLPPLLDVDGAAVTKGELGYALRMLDVLRRRAGLDPRRVRLWRMIGPRQLAAFGHRGSIYGSAPVGLLGALRPAPRIQGIEGLALAGGTVHPGGGIPLVLLSGRNAADEVLRSLA